MRPEDLIRRWKTPSGAATREGVVDALSHDNDFRQSLRDLPGILEAFEGLDLRGLDASGIKFGTKLFTSASLDFACMDRCRFSEAGLDFTYLIYTSFDQSTFYRTQIMEANAFHASFDFATLHKVLMMGTKMSFSSFKGATLEDCDLSRCMCLSTDFCGAILRRVNFAETTIDQCNFADAVIIDCNFDDARIYKTMLPTSSGA